MRIGVSGASGNLGRAVLKRLGELPGQRKIVAISRSPQSANKADDSRFGDYDAPATLHRAYAGLDRLLIIPSLDMGNGVRARQLVAAIDAAVAAGVGHIVLISDVGTREEDEPHVGAASWIGEQHLIKSVTTWTILRANYFMESFAEEMLLWQSLGRLAELSENRVAFVSRDDLAIAAAGVLTGSGHVGAIYNATGVQAFSVAERAALISKLSGKSIEIIQTSLAGLRDELRAAKFPEEYLDLAVDTKRKTSEGGFDIVTGDVERLSGRRPTSLEDVLADYIVNER